MNFTDLDQIAQEMADERAEIEYNRRAAEKQDRFEAEQAEYEQQRYLAEMTERHAEALSDGDTELDFEAWLEEEENEQVARWESMYDY